MSCKFVSLFAAIAIVAASTASASAEQGVRTTHVSVSYADLDLTRAEGVKTLSSRLNRAANRVCGSSRGSVSLTISRAIEACRAKAISSAVASIDAPLLKAFHGSSKDSRIAGV